MHIHILKNVKNIKYTLLLKFEDETSHYKDLTWPKKVSLILNKKL